MIGKVTLTGGNKCPVCGKDFFATPPLRPNIEGREFYGGRIKFFKKVECDCLGEYDLCIEKRYNAQKCEEEFNVINMIVIKEGTPLEELREQRAEQAFMEAGEKTKEDVAKITEEQGYLPPLAVRKKIQKENVLATIVDLDTKIDTLCLHTIKELQTMCKKRKVKFSVRWTKKEYAKALLSNDPALVVANPEG